MKHKLKRLANAAARQFLRHLSRLLATRPRLRVVLYRGFKYLPKPFNEAIARHYFGTWSEADIDATETALIIADNQSGPIKPRLLVDVSSLVRVDAGSGIQRVVKAILINILSENHEWRAEPIYRDGNSYRYARKFRCDFLNVDAGNLTDAVVGFHPTDTFLGLDLDPEITELALEILRYNQRRGMRVIFVVYDLLPILRPDWFEANVAKLMNLWFRRIVTIADQLVAISRTVANEIVTFLDRRPNPLTRRPMIAWWHLGSDFMETAAAHQAPQTPESNDFDVFGRAVFLTVGTIEPRKGIGHLLNAAEELWRTHDATFVIAGKQGWLVTDLMQRMAAHPEFGKRLLWIDRPSDAVLDRLYGLATAVLLPSMGEGFGLPLIEAAKRKTPIIARDIPVFREIGGSNVFYFSADSGVELAEALRKWMALYQRGEAPKPDMKVLTWRESSEQLLAVIRSGATTHDLAGDQRST